MSTSAKFQTPENKLRHVIFRPFSSAHPWFVLKVWDTHTRDELGKWRLAYTLTQRETGKPPLVLFDGADFCCSPCHAVDSDACIESLMSFLCLRPGDTDDEYFAHYTPAQKEFCEQHAEALGCEVQARYCDENGRVKT